MKILDIFSWLPENELSIEEMQSIVTGLYEGDSNCEGYFLENQLPEGADENIIGSQNELISEGKKVCFLMKNDKVVSVVGFREE